MITWEPSTPTMSAPARSAIERTTSVPAALSPVAMTAHEGRSFQPGAPDGSERASSAKGRWVAVVGSAVEEQHRRPVRWTGFDVADLEHTGIDLLDGPKRGAG
jgi:hypothetical protein